MLNVPRSDIPAVTHVDCSARVQTVTPDANPDYVITPVAVLLRLFGKSPLMHRERDGGFWMPAASDGRSDLESQF